MTKELDKILEDGASDSTFEDAIKLFQKTEGLDDLIPEDTKLDMSDTDVEDDEELENEEVEEDGIDNDDEEEIVEDNTTNSAVDWQRLYEAQASQTQQLQQHMMNLENKITEISSKKDNKQDLTPVVKNQDEVNLAEDPNMKDLFEYYPELVKPVQHLIDSKVAQQAGAFEAAMNKLVDERVSPIANQIKETEEQAHRSAILQAHPDVSSHIESGNFNKWMDSLPSYQKTGAQYVYNYGSAPEVIALLDSYKEASAKSSDTGTSADVKKKSTRVQNDDTVQKVVNSMYVKSENNEPNVNKKATTMEDLAENDPKKAFEIFSKHVLQENSVI